jgi:hypothetical protein
MTALLTAQRLWVCPNCPAQDVTTEARPHTRYHACPGLHGLTAPMVEAGSRVRVTAVEREDYVGDETVTSVGGRPIMAVKTERQDGSNDVMVFAPLASGKVSEDS